MVYIQAARPPTAVLDMNTTLVMYVRFVLLQGAAGFTVPMWIYNGDSSNTNSNGSANGNGNSNGNGTTNSSSSTATPTTTTSTTTSTASEKTASKSSSKSKNKVCVVGGGWWWLVCYLLVRLGVLFSVLVWSRWIICFKSRPENKIKCFVCFLFCRFCPFSVD